VRSRAEGRARFPVVVPMQEQSGYHAYVTTES